MKEQWKLDDVPQVSPDDKFRQELHLALEQTYRQQMARRQLGAAPTPAPARPWLAMIAGVMAFGALIGLAWRVRRRFLRR
jgi:ferric-dicitrate binding protein FerR (iron transport regulator)